MWPWGHLAVGYLAYAAVLHPRLRRAPEGPAVLVLAAATQLPDVVDKTLAWHLGLLPGGRTLAHSALVAAVVIAVVGAYLRSTERPRLALALGVGYASHLVADSYEAVLAGRWADLAFLAWPLIPAVEGGGPSSVVGRFVELAAQVAAGDVSAFLAFELALVLVAAALWIAHGRPGPGALRRRLG